MLTCVYRSWIQRAAAPLVGLGATILMVLFLDRQATRREGTAFTDGFRAGVQAALKEIAHAQQEAGDTNVLAIRLEKLTFQFDVTNSVTGQGGVP